MATFFLKENNAKSTLSSDIAAGATSLVVASASSFPASGDFIVTLWDKDTYTDPGDDSNMEMVKVTAVSGTTFTVTRAQESTTGVTHSSGDAVELLFTVGQIEELEDEINNHTHDGRYYTETEIDTALSGKSSTGHTHLEADITDLDKYTQTEVDNLLANKAAASHTHTESDITDLDHYVTADFNTDFGTKNLDDLADGTTYGRVKNSELTAGQVNKLDDGTNEASAADTKSAIDLKHAEAHNVASHSDTTATGTELEQLTDGSNTALHVHDIYSLDTDLSTHISDTTAIHGIADTTDLALKSGNVNQFADITSAGADIESAVSLKHAQNSDTDLDATFEATFVKKADNVNVLADITSAGADIESAVSLKHAQDHDIDSTSDHNGVSGATEDNFLSFDANGLPKDSGKDDTDYADTAHDHDITYPLRTEWLQNGIVDRADSTLAFNDGTRVFTINRTGASFDYFIQGVKYIVTTDDAVGANTVTLTDGGGDEEGLWVIYYVGATLTALKNPSHSQIEDLICTKCLVGIVYYDDTNSQGILYDERHGTSMSPFTHRYLHESVGFAYTDGLALGDFVISDGADNEDAQFSIASGECYDEDLPIELNAINATTGINIFYRDGSDWRWTTQTGFKCMTFDGTDGTRLAYDNAGTLAEVGSTNFVLLHIFATNAYDEDSIAVIGQAQYATKRAAVEAALTEINNLVLGTLPSAEMKPIATVIYQTKDSYNNDVNAKIVQTDSGDNYVDWRTTALAAGVSASDHGSLGGLTDDDHEHYLLADGTRDLTGNMLVDALVTIDGRDLSVDGSKLDAIEALADVTDSTNVDGAGAVMEADFDANTILAATSNDTPVTLTVTEQTLVGRITSGNIAALSTTQIRTLINVEDGATADQTGAEIKSAYEGEANTNAYTDAEVSKLAAIEATADITDATNVAAALASINVNTLADITSAGADIEDAVTKKHANTLDHTQNTDTELDNGVVDVDGSDNVTINQNSVAAFTSINASAEVNTLYLKEGDVGIGTVPNSSYKLYLYNAADSEATKFKVENANTVASDGAAFAAMELTANGNVTSQLALYGTNFADPIHAGYARFGTNTNGWIFESTHAAGVMKFYTGGQVAANLRMTILANGNIGIGDDAPNTLLSVGTMETAGTAANIHVKSDSDHLGIHLEENSGAEGWQIGVDAAGDLNFHNSFNATPTVSFRDDDVVDLLKGQLNFPASQNASADANTIDDYEKGTWALTITCGTSGTVTVNPNWNVGSYTKVGDIVHCQGAIAVSAVDAPLGEIRISLPFTSAALEDNADQAVGSILTEGMAFATTGTMVARIVSGLAYFRIFGNNTNGAKTNENANTLAVSDEIAFQITYKV